MGDTIPTNGMPKKVGADRKMELLKILVMGMPASGKTTFVKHVFEEKRFEEIRNYTPTFGVSIALHNYGSSGEVKVSTFDCGGQTSFVDTYFTDRWVPKLFGSVSVLFFLVDSSAADTLERSVSLFRKYYENVRRNSPDAEIFLLASKWDAHRLSEEDLVKAFKGMKVYPVSVVNGSAKKVAWGLLDDLLGKRKEAAELELVEDLMGRRKGPFEA